LIRCLSGAILGADPAANYGTLAAASKMERLPLNSTERGDWEAKPWRVVAELASNLDQFLSCGGSLPVAWLGPTCMQEPSDLEARRRDSLESAAKMSRQQRQDAIWGYVEVLPEPPPQRLIADRLFRRRHGI
jgi:hypothetical protein